MSIMLLLASFPRYWNYKIENRAVPLPRGITEDGSPWIGAENPELTITEYSDYLCFQCKKMHFFLRNLASQYPEKIRIVHKNFPMDHKINPLVTEAFHVGSGLLALLTRYALARNRFWELNDYLYLYSDKESFVDLQEIALKTGLDTDGLIQAVQNRTYHSHILKEIREGILLSVRGTPSYVIDEELYSGQIPAAVLKNYLE